MQHQLWYICKAGLCAWSNGICSWQEPTDPIFIAFLNLMEKESVQPT